MSGTPGRLSPAAHRANGEPLHERPAACPDHLPSRRPRTYGGTGRVQDRFHAPARTSSASPMPTRYGPPSCTPPGADSAMPSGPDADRLCGPRRCGCCRRSAVGTWRRSRTRGVRGLGVADRGPVAELLVRRRGPYRITSRRQDAEEARRSAVAVRPGEPLRRGLRKRVSLRQPRRPTSFQAAGSAPIASAAFSASPSRNGTRPAAIAALADMPVDSARYGTPTA